MVRLVEKGDLKERGNVGSPRRRWGNCIETDLEGIGLEGVDWINLAQVRDRLQDVLTTETALQIT